MKMYVPLVTQMGLPLKLVAIIQETIFGLILEKPVVLINVSKSVKLFLTAKWPCGIRPITIVF